MQSLTFFIDHKPSSSRAIVEFGLIDKKVKMTACYFVKGNIVSLKAVKACYKQARTYFSN